MLERTVWHSTQHARQVASLLEQAGVTPAQPLSSRAHRGLAVDRENLGRVATQVQIDDELIAAR